MVHEPGRLPGLLGCAMLILEDACPPEPDKYLCAMQEDSDGGSCRLCWNRYLMYVANGRKYDPYKCEHIFEGGMIG